MAKDLAPDEAKQVVSHTGQILSRPVAFRFALDPTREQAARFFAHAGAARVAFNHHLARVKANLDQREAERSYGIAEKDLTPALSWSKVSFINEFNAWKNGKLASSPVAEDGTRGLRWRHEVSQDVFECASVNAAQALANFSASRKGTQAGKTVRFPKFKSRHKTSPSFKLRSKSKPGQTAPIRVAGPKALRLPTIGEVRVHGCTKQVRRMLTAGRLHLYGATLTFERGRWWISLQGIAAQFHPERRSEKGRHQVSAGVDRGIKSLAVIADADGALLHTVEGVKALRTAELRLRRANKALARTKPGSRGRAKAKQRLTRLHARVAHLRAHVSHDASYKLATTLTRLVIEDLNIGGMTQLRSLAKAVADAAMGELGRRLTYKANWYGLELVEADRWFPSSKTCSGCGALDPDLSLSDRTYRCDACGLVIDRDLNAAINLARWQQPPATAETPPELPLVA
ncbi:MAG: RNA-guided endonuclease TnpB family protein [Nocardioidaceae bacterium]